MTKRIFLRSGGGLPGLDIHCGIWAALADHGIHADANAGTSAGAIVAAFASYGHDWGILQHVLLSLKDSDVRQERFAWKLRVPWIDSFLSHDPIEKLLRKYLPETFDKLSKPLCIELTQHLAGLNFKATRGDLIKSILASMSISGVFPPVEIDGLFYSDGGTTQNVPWPNFNLNEYDEIWILIAARPIAYKGHGMLGALMWNMDLMANDQILDTITSLKKLYGPKVKVIWPRIDDLATGALRFDHSLIKLAYDLATRQLDRMP